MSTLKPNQIFPKPTAYRNFTENSTTLLNDEKKKTKPTNSLSFKIFLVKKITRNINSLWLKNTCFPRHEKCISYFELAERTRRRPKTEYSYSLERERLITD